MIAVIATILNEGDSLHRLMGSLLAQTHPPDEVIIVDGGSADNSIAIIEQYRDRLPLRLLVEPGCNISAGRNRAVTAARADIIASTDAGVTLHPQWLEALTLPLRVNPAVQVCAGFFRAESTTRFELAMSAAVLPLLEEIDPAAFLPSSRSVAFRKTAWERVGGYPEWLDYCEDLVFDLRLRRMVGPFAFAPEALVDFRPRGSLPAFFRQYYRYARGDGKADLWRRRHAARYLTYLVMVPLIALAGWLIHPVLWLLYAPGALLYLRQPYRRLVSLRPADLPLSLADHLIVWLCIPLIRVVGDIAKMLGYPAGWLWRWRHRPPDWRR